MANKKWMALITYCLLVNFLVFSQAEEEPVDPYGQYEQKQYSEAAEGFLKLALQNEGGERQNSLLYNAARSFQEDFAVNKNSESLNRAVSLYYRILELDKGHTAAAHNLELARMIQKQEQGQKEPEGQNGQKDLSDKQEQLARRDDQSEKEHRKEQEELKNKTEDQMNKAGTPQEKQALREALEKQAEALEQMEENNAEEARKAQQEAAAKLKEYESLQQGDENPDKKDLDQDIKNILNAEAARRDQEKDPEDYYRVEKNW